eukprot:15074179-Heterocapsa_arctica.AAC.1
MAFLCVRGGLECQDDLRWRGGVAVEEVPSILFEEIGTDDDLQLRDDNDARSRALDYCLLNVRRDCSLGIFGGDGEGVPKVPFGRVQESLHGGSEPRAGVGGLAE